MDSEAAIFDRQNVLVVSAQKYVNGIILLCHVLGL